MKMIFLTLILGLTMSLGLSAQNEMWIYNSDGTIKTCKVSEIDSINFSTQMLDMLLYKNGDNTQFSVATIDSIIFKHIVMPDDNQGDDNTGDTISSVVYVEFDGDMATVRHDIASEDFVVNVEGADVNIVTNAAIENIQYCLSGLTPNGSFSLESDSEFSVLLNGVDITSSSKVPLNLAKKVERDIIVADETVNILTDNTESDGKAVINTKGATNIKGAGSLTINANKKHGISSDYDININDVNLTISHSAEASKGLKSDANIILDDADVTIISSGTLTLDELALGYDPTYCTAIGADGNFEMINGNLSITLPESNVAGRGIKVDGNISIFDGNVNIISHGGGDTYTNSEGEIDSYKSSCVKADGNIYLVAGNIVIEATGAAGKCVNADGEIHIGKEYEENTLTLKIKTSGNKFYESGSGENADYANPKALSAEGDLYVYGGDIDVYTENDGGEGLESKKTVYIKGGNITIDTYDDAINGKSHVQIDGGPF